MSYFLSFKIASLVFVLLLNSILLILVYKQNNTSATNRLFVALCLVISLWSIVLFVDNQLNTNIYMARMSIFLATPMSLLFFMFAHTFPSEKVLLQKKYVYVSFFLTLCVMIINLTPAAFKGVAIVNNSPEVTSGPGMLPFTLFTTFFNVGAVYILLKKFKLAIGTERKQLKYIVGGIMLMLGLVILTILLPVILLKNNFFVSFVPLYVLFFSFFTTIAILKYHLFNIKVIATEILILVLIFILFFEGLLSGSLFTIIYKIFFAILVGLLGVLLVKSVKKEIKQRERLEIVTNELQKANSKLKELDQQKTDFLSIAAHQLRTPMSIMNGYIELIKDYAYGKVTDETKGILDNMDESNQRLIKLVDEFLDITRIEQGRTKFDFSPKDLREIVDSAVKELSKRAEQKGLSLEWKKPIKPLIASVDDEKIRHVVFNFIDNAIKYSHKGSIKLEAKEDDGGITVRVFDHGFGFNAIDEQNFFQKFYRGENVKRTDVSGTGLGLYVCRKFIESHNGKIWAHSPGLGKGSEFGFWVPAKQG